MAPAHPRVCGENRRRRTGPGFSGGSSPRVRGKQALPRLQAAQPGLIPAYAGKTLECDLHVRRSSAHPRVCGENGRADLAYPVLGGSSPRVRGKRTVHERPWMTTGLIPACAGKTSTPTSRPCPPRAHPRVCGENSAASCHVSSKLGSSPRVRGKPGHHDGLRATARLIPACAEKTAADHAGGTAYRAHPRVCGENLIPVIEALVPVGSSPRVRGKLDEQGQDDAVRGLIPACAGKTRVRCEEVR